MPTDPRKCPLLPIHHIQDLVMPLVLKIHQYTEEPLGGYMGACTAFGLGRALFTADNSAWDVSVVSPKCLSSERCEVTNDGIQRVGVVREGRVVQEFQSHDDLSTALAMLKRASSSGSRPSAQASSDGHLPEAACPVPEGYDRSAVNATAVNPQQADVLIQRMRSAYMDLFDVTNEYEEELMQQIKSELQHDDEVDDAVRAYDAKNPSAKSTSATATTKLGKNMPVRQLLNTRPLLYLPRQSWNHRRFFLHSRNRWSRKPLSTVTRLWTASNNDA